MPNDMGKGIPRTGASTVGGEVARTSRNTAPVARVFAMRRRQVGTLSAAAAKP
jgi:hypothetical protein